jgi:ketosteroid isomerase-like protein
MFVTAKGLRLVGRDAIRRFYAERLTRVTIVSVRCATKKLQSAATMAWEYGSCASTLRMSSGLRSFTSSYLTVWHQDADGKWRIAANMA